jgi:hypothetical protein
MFAICPALEVAGLIRMTPVRPCDLEPTYRQSNTNVQWHCRR